VLEYKRERVSETIMRLRYVGTDGMLCRIELGDQPITIGRSPEADVCVPDEKISRLHCGIRLWDGEYYARDLKSKNGTHLNGVPIEVARLAPGDVLRLGKTELFVETLSAKGATTGLHSVEEDMASGKGYSTILHEIVSDINAPSPKPTERLQAHRPPPNP